METRFIAFRNIIFDFEAGFIGDEIWIARERKKKKKKKGGKVGGENWGHNGGDNGINYQRRGERRNALYHDDEHILTDSRFGHTAVNPDTLRPHINLIILTRAYPISVSYAEHRFIPVRGSSGILTFPRFTRVEPLIFNPAFH